MVIARTALILLLFTIAQEAFSQTPQMNNGTSPAKLYAGKTADHWISEVVRLAVTVRSTEEDYEQSRRACVKQGKTIEDPAPVCIRAKHSYYASQAARNEYQRLLNTVSRTSLPVEWLRANFTWVRFGPEWKQ
jgi:hypothetical protein